MIDYDEIEDDTERIDLINERIYEIESDIEYYERVYCSDQCGRKEGLIKIAELENELYNLQDMLEYYGR